MVANNKSTDMGRSLEKLHKIYKVLSATTDEEVLLPLINEAVRKEQRRTGGQLDEEKRRFIELRVESLFKKGKIDNALASKLLEALSIVTAMASETMDCHRGKFRMNTMLQQMDWVMTLLETERSEKGDMATNIKDLEDKIEQLQLKDYASESESTAEAAKEKQEHEGQLNAAKAEAAKATDTANTLRKEKHELEAQLAAVENSRRNEDELKEQRAEAKAVADLVHIFHLLEAEKKATDTANTLREEKQKLQDLLAAAEIKVNKLQKKSKSRKSKASKLKVKLATTKAEAMDNLEILGNEYEILLESKVNKL